MKLKLYRGTTNKLLRIFVQNSASASISGLTGLAYNTSGLSWYYCREGDSASTAVTLAAATLGTYSSGGLVAVDPTNMPGVYEIGVPAAALASGNSVVMMLQGAANMSPVLIEIELDAVNYQSNTSFVASVPAVPGTVGSVTGLTPSTIASAILATPAQKVQTDSAGNVLISGTQAVPLTGNAGNSVFDCLNAARAQGFGKWQLAGTSLTLFGSDGTTVVRTFTLDSATSPTVRS